ncbi:rplM, partial [Symbiodinium natans]
MANKTLEFFAVPAAEVLLPGEQDLAKVEVKCVSEMPILKIDARLIVADDEGVQHKAFNYAWEKLHLRGFQEVYNPRGAHYSVVEIEFDLTLGPLAGNFDHGAFKSGDKLEAKRDAFEAYLEEQDEDYFEQFAERVSRDSGQPYDPDLHPGDCMAEYMSSRALRNRGQYVPRQVYVKQKAWFGLHSALRDMLKDWTVQEERVPGDQPAEQDEGDPGAEAEEAEEETPREPRNKSELYQMFNKKGPTNMIAGFMSDPYLRQVAHMITHISQPLEDAYHAALEAASQGWHDQADFAARRSLGSFTDTVYQLLATLQKAPLHDALGMTKATRQVAPAEMAAWASAEQELLRTCHEFAACLSANVFWSNAHYFMSLPAFLASILSKRRAERETAMTHARSLVSAVIDAEKHQSEHPAAWQALLDDLAWHKQQLPRETMALCLQSGFDSNDVRLKQLAKRLYLGSPSTKDTLENTFAFLHRKASTHSTNFKMSDACKWLYSIVSPYAETGGCPQLLPERSDFATVLGPNGFPDRNYANRHMFAPKKTQLPKPTVLHRPKDMKKSKWRSSGPLSQQRSSAAAAYLIADKADTWSNLDLCWVGRSVCVENCLSLQASNFFKQGSVFKYESEVEDEEFYVLSLGFRRWAAAGYPLERVSVEGK